MISYFINICLGGKMELVFLCGISFFVFICSFVYNSEGMGII